MSKTYEALRKAEAARMPPPEALNVPGTMPNDVPGTNGAHAKGNGAKKNGAQATRLEYETIRVWLKNPVAHGQRLPVTKEGLAQDEAVALIRGSDLIAIYKRRDAELVPERVLVGGS